MYQVFIQCSVLVTVRDIRDVTLEIVLFLKCSSVAFLFFFFQTVTELELRKPIIRLEFKFERFEFCCYRNRF